MLMFGYFGAAVLFYVVVRFVTRDESIEWWHPLLWVMGTRAAGLIVRLSLGATGLNIFDSVFADILGTAAGITVLTLILVSQGYAPRQVVAIISLLVLVQALPIGFMLAAKTA